jgi:hypothetical protein
MRREQVQNGALMAGLLEQSMSIDCITHGPTAEQCTLNIDSTFGDTGHCVTKMPRLDAEETCHMRYQLKDG